MVLQDHVTSQNYYISATTVPAAVPMATKPGFIFSCNHCSCTIFTLTSYSLYTQVHANLYFNQCSIFTKCFQLQNRFEWSKYLLVRLPSLNYKISPSKISYFPLPVNAIWKPCLTTWQIKNITSPLPHCLWPLNLLSWWLILWGPIQIVTQSLITRPC